MHTFQTSLTPPSWPGEWQRLRSALLTDQDGILTETRRRLARLAQARGIEPHAIDDVVQETLLEAWSHLERLHTPAGFPLWIDEICRNVCRRTAHRREMDLLRRTSLSSPVPNEEERDVLAHLPAPDAFDPFEELSRQDLLLLLERALGTLPQAARQLVELCYLRELPHAEVAEQLGITSGALDTRLHRARRQLRQIFSGPLREEAQGFGLALDETRASGWQETRLWCPRCMQRRLQGCFMHPDAEEGPNLHLRCPDCSRRYGQDAVHSMGLVSLAGLHAFRPAWKRVMQGLTDTMLHALACGQYPCWYCGKPALMEVMSGTSNEAPSADLSATARSSEPHDSCPFWMRLYCLSCGQDAEIQCNLPSVDQLVYWAHPLTRQFLLQHPRWSSAPGRVVEYAGLPAIHFHLADLESNDALTILAHRQTLQPLVVS
ncbi:MAG TPA: sigma-70 family RNA polymerase sigma factor [Ktedonobacteraceae bacterium]|nr:sigma-70 family RNA polymerase sigma factor [Ktedonobacteraceae bacterium]